MYAFVLIFCVWTCLFVCVCACLCVCERIQIVRVFEFVCVSVCVCICDIPRENGTSGYILVN